MTADSLPSASTVKGAPECDVYVNKVVAIKRYFGTETATDLDVFLKASATSVSNRGALYRYHYVGQNTGWQAWQTTSGNNGNNVIVSGDGARMDYFEVRLSIALEKQDGATNAVDAVQALFFADYDNGDGTSTRHWARTADGKPLTLDANFVKNLPAQDVLTNGNERTGGGDASWWPGAEEGIETIADFTATKGSARYINPDACRWQFPSP